LKIVTITDVAKAARVSISTVSRVLNKCQAVDPDTRDRVIATVRKMNYVRNMSASNLKQQHIAAIGVILRGRRNAFLAPLSEQVLEAGRGTGFQFIIEVIDEKANQLLAAHQLYLEHKLRGVIFLGTNQGIQDESRMMELPQVYVTVGAGHLNSPFISSVSVDNRLAGRVAVEQLIKAGHRDIALLGYFGKESDSTGLRLYGAVEAMEAAGIRYDPDLYRECAFTLASGYENTRKLLERGKPFTAMFTACDFIAIGARKALGEAGLRVPDNVSIIGFDGIEIGRYLIPAISTMLQPTDRMAEQAVLLMQQLIEGKPSSHVLLGCEYLPGGSVRDL
jgi:LacI family transcriptional regulator